MQSVIGGGIGHFEDTVGIQLQRPLDRQDLEEALRAHEVEGGIASAEEMGFLTASGGAQPDLPVTVVPDLDRRRTAATTRSSLRSCSRSPRQNHETNNRDDGDSSSSGHGDDDDVDAGSNSTQTSPSTRMGSWWMLSRRRVWALLAPLLLCR